MMERLWSNILNRFGQDVTLRKKEGDVTLRALIQPCMERGIQQELPGALGLGRQDRFRYFGPAQYPLDLDTIVVWKEKGYRVQLAQLAGDGVCPHCRAVLYPREEAAV